MGKYHLELLAIIAKLENRLCCPTHCCVFVNRYSIVGVDDWSAEFVIIVSNDSSSVIVQSLYLTGFKDEWNVSRDFFYFIPTLIKSSIYLLRV